MDPGVLLPPEMTTILAALRGKLVTGLITNEATAELLLDA